MTTSGTSSFTMNRDLIVRRSLRMVGAYTSTDLPRPEQLTDAISTLNMMIKSWSLLGLLWLRDFTEITMVANTNSYQLGPASTVPMDRPTHVFTANRKSSSGMEVPLVSLSRVDYMAVPNKSSTSSGGPVQYYYDATTINGTLYVWPTPATGTTDKVVLDHDRQIDIMNDSFDDFDFPPHWIEVITYSLAARIAPEYGLAIEERVQLEKEASELLNGTLQDDRDMSSIRFEVRR